MGPAAGKKPWIANKTIGFTSVECSMISKQNYHPSTQPSVVIIEQMSVTFKQLDSNGCISKVLLLTLDKGFAFFHLHRSVTLSCWSEKPPDKFPLLEQLCAGERAVATSLSALQQAPGRDHSN